MTLTGLDIDILLPALLAGLLVLATHMPLGAKVLERGIIFMDLAVAQFAAFGVTLAYVLGHGGHGIWMQVAAYAAALAGVGGLYWAARRWSDVQEAIIGTSFVMAATGILVLLAGDPRGGEHLADLLAGQILWTDWTTLWPLLGVSLLVLLIWRATRGCFTELGFYVSFALAVTASVQVVGVYLVFASLIVPALATRKLAGARRWMVAGGAGSLGYAAGLGISALYDMPASPLIVWMLVVTALLAARLPAAMR